MTRRQSQRERLRQDKILLDEAEAEVDALFERLSAKPPMVPMHEGREYLATMAADRGNPGPLRRLYPHLARFIQVPEFPPGRKHLELQDLGEHGANVRAATYRADCMRKLLPRRLGRDADSRAADLMGVSASDVERERKNRVRRKPRSY